VCYHYDIEIYTLVVLSLCQGWGVFEALSKLSTGESMGRTADGFEVVPKTEFLGKYF